MSLRCGAAGVYKQLLEGRLLKPINFIWDMASWGLCWPFKIFRSRFFQSTQPMTTRHGPHAEPFALLTPLSPPPPPLLLYLPLSGQRQQPQTEHSGGPLGDPSARVFEVYLTVLKVSNSQSVIRRHSPNIKIGEEIGEDGIVGRGRNRG